MLLQELTKSLSLHTAGCNKGSSGLSKSLSTCPKGQCRKTNRNSEHHLKRAVESSACGQENLRQIQKLNLNRLLPKPWFVNFVEEARKRGFGSV